MRPLRLHEIHEEPRFGGKAVQLGQALRAGLPVPSGLGLSVAFVARVADGDTAALAECEALFAALDVEGVAVRSSAVGEDAAGASFAGQHLTRLNVAHAENVAEAVHAVWQSGRSDSALAYRQRLGLEREPRVAVVVQQMVVAECAGVLFTRHPVDGRDVRVIEATWGLGEAVVAGLVEPDRWIMGRGGELLEHTIGDKDVAIRAASPGQTEEVAVHEQLRSAACLSVSRLEQLEELAQRCEAAFEGAHDIEFAFDGAEIYLLQRRAVTR